MRIPRPFSPLEPGETDNFVFDFTGDQGNANPATVAFTCSLSSGTDTTVAQDPSPNSRVLSSIIQTTLYVRSPITNVVTVRTGCFAVASVGGLPTTAVGATYVLEAQMTFSDGRTVSYNSTFLCQNVGY